LTGSYFSERKPPRPSKPKTIIPANLRDVYAEVVAKVVELRERGLTHLEVRDELNRQGFRTDGQGVGARPADHQVASFLRKRGLICRTCPMRQPGAVLAVVENAVIMAGLPIELRADESRNRSIQDRVGP
jgi:hypothetical protein